MEPVTDPLRVRTWDEYIGQPRLKKELDVRIRAALKRERPLDHVLLAGPPGMGKTTIAGIIASRLHDPFHALSMPVKAAVLASFLRSQQDGLVLLLDEIHRCPKSQQEDLLTLLEEGYLHTTSGLRIECRWLTVVGATTEPENIIPPLYSRFPIRPPIVDYSPEELLAIVQLLATKVNVVLGEEDAMMLAKASAGVPRSARQLVLAARDLAATTGQPPTGAEVLELCNVDPTGLSENHLRYLECLRQLGGRGGLGVMSTMLRLHESVVRELERLLVKRDLIIYGERGRELTGEGWAHGRAPVDRRRRAS